MINHDVIIIGGGIAGLRAALECKDLDVAIISKLHPLRSHSGAAQGGVNAPLNLDDDWQDFMYDTVLGSDFLADQNAVEILSRKARLNIIEIEQLGTIFSRTEEGKIAQRQMGGQNFKRTCYSEDKTGQTILTALFEQFQRNKIKIYGEWNILSLAIKNNSCCGVVAYNMKTGDVQLLKAKSVILATGGFCRLFSLTSNPNSNTGDGPAMILRTGAPLMDMEFIQFHPTGLYKKGILISEAARGDGGILLNNREERFMKYYAPKKLGLAPRDITTRAIQTEIDSVRGINRKDYVHLDLTKLGKQKIMEKLPQIHSLIKDFAGIDCITEPVPVQPVAHHSMGGIPVDVFGRVTIDSKGNFIEGLYATGECACLSVHGANRIGGNSLLEAIVFGKITGEEANKFVKEREFEEINEDELLSNIKNFIQLIKQNNGKEKTAVIKEELQKTMMKHCGIIRKEQGLKKALDKIRELKKRFKDIGIQDKSLTFNTDLIQVFELRNMLDLSEVIAACALERKETRGCHYRLDHKKRDDKKYLCHTLAYKDKGRIKLAYKPVNITKFKPTVRKY